MGGGGLVELRLGCRFSFGVAAKSEVVVMDVLENAHNESWPSCFVFFINLLPEIYFFLQSVVRVAYTA